MPIPSVTGIAAEKHLIELANEVGCENAEDIANVMELLISKAARAVEKYAGNERAQLVLKRTSFQLESKPAVANRH